MARYQVTLRQPAGATPAIPPIVVSNFGEDGYSSSLIQAVVLSGFTEGGGLITQGTDLPDRRAWALSAKESEATCLIFEALYNWQKSRYDARQDGRLELVDEFEYAIPQVTPTTTFLAGSTINPAPGLTTGFGIYRVFITLPEGHKRHVGVNAQRTLMKRLTFRAEEAPLA